MISLRKYQLESKRQINEYFDQNGQKVLLQMPTGAGKTRVFCSIIHEKLNTRKNFKCIVVAHTEELINQIRQTLSDYAIETGIIKAGYPRDYYQSVQVASIGTLAGDFHLDGNVDMIVIDEAHRTGAPQYKELFKRFPKAKFLGATATPCRMDGQPLSDFYDKIVLGPNIRELIQIGHLATVSLYSPQEVLEGISDISTGVDGDYANAALAGLLNKEIIRARLVNSYIKHCYGKKGIVYAINRDHAKAICNDYNRQNISAEYIVSGDEMTAEQRKDKVKRFIKGDFKVLVNVNIFSEGFDCPDADFVQLARPTKSLILYFQQIGRALRTSPKKKNAIILDNAGLTLEHGSFISNQWDWEGIFSEGLNNIEEFRRVDTDERGISDIVRDDNIIFEGDEELILEEFGTVLTDDDPLIEFFSEALRNLYETIRTLRHVRTNDYESIPVVETINILEPYLFSLAIQNKEFYEETEVQLDKLNIDKSIREAEFKKMDGILNSYENNVNKLEINKISAILKGNRELGLIYLADQKSGLQKTLQTKFLLPLEVTDELIEGTFDIENIRNEKADLESKITIDNQNVQVLIDRLVEIKGNAKKGILAKSEFEVRPEINKDEESLLIYDEDVQIDDDDLPFDEAEKKTFANIIDHPWVKNSSILIDVFGKLMDSTDESFVANLKELYDYPNRFYKKSGFGNTKVKETKRLIRLFLLNKEKVKTLDPNIGNYKNELMYIQDVLLESDHTNKIVKEIIQYTKNHKIFIREGKIKTLEDISQELNETWATVKTASSRFSVEDKVKLLVEDLSKNRKTENLDKLKDLLIPHKKDIIRVVDPAQLNTAFGVDFNSYGYSLIARELFIGSDLTFIGNVKLKFLYSYRYAFDLKKVDVIISRLLPTNNHPLSSIKTAEFNDYEKNLMETICKEETVYKILEINDVFLFYNSKYPLNISVRVLLMLALKTINKPATSSQIYAWCNENYPGVITDPMRMVSDYIYRMDDSILGDGIGVSRKYKLREYKQI